jgi:hypothetical protein
MFLQKLKNVTLPNRDLLSVQEGSSKSINRFTNPVRTEPEPIENEIKVESGTGTGTGTSVCRTACIDFDLFKVYLSHNKKYLIISIIRPDSVCYRIVFNNVSGKFLSVIKDIINPELINKLNLILNPASGTSSGQNEGLVTAVSALAASPKATQTTSVLPATIRLQQQPASSSGSYDAQSEGEQQQQQPASSSWVRSERQKEHSRVNF